jgi:TMEM175 potassium channel family protein
MSKSRMEAFSDAVFAIIITIMVLEIKVPHGAELTALRPLIPVFLSYALSFLYLGIYWSNHHHMLYVTHGVNAAILWANLHLLFWLSLVPFVTGWMGESHLAPGPTAVYGVILVLAAIAYLLLQHAILRQEGPDSTLAAAIGRDWKGKISPLIYAVAILVAFVRPWMAGGLYVVAAVMWLIPDRRIERRVSGVGREVSVVREA